MDFKRVTEPGRTDTICLAVLSKGRSAPELCECGRVHFSKNVVDLASYRAARATKAAARAIARSGSPGDARSVSFASIIWPPLMFPLLWTTYWVSVCPMDFVRRPGASADLD